MVDHYDNPRNVGSFNKNDEDVGTGLVGAPACGDVMKLQLRVRLVILCPLRSAGTGLCHYPCLWHELGIFVLHCWLSCRSGQQKPLLTLLCWLSLWQSSHWQLVHPVGGRRRPHRGVVLQDIRLRFGHCQQQRGHRVVGAVRAALSA